LKDFKGHIVHSAVWDHDYDFHDKKVAVIGNGSSAIQIVPSIQPIVKHLTTFIRSPTWISVNFAAQHAGPDGKNFKYSEEQLKDFQDDEKLLAYRRKIEHDFNKLYRGLEYGTPEHEFFSTASRELMVERLNRDTELIDKLIPDWAFGCRRLSPGDGYLEALRAPNTTPVFNAAAKITENGVIDSTE
jgi:Predicted flavoprotein involved in K+ transport